MWGDGTKCDEKLEKTDPGVCPEECKEDINELINACDNCEEVSYVSILVKFLLPPFTKKIRNTAFFEYSFLSLSLSFVGRFFYRYVCDSEVVLSELDEGANLEAVTLVFETNAYFKVVRHVHMTNLR